MSGVGMIVVAYTNMSLILGSKSESVSIIRVCNSLQLQARMNVPQHNYS